MSNLRRAAHLLRILSKTGEKKDDLDQIVEDAAARASKLSDQLRSATKDIAATVRRSNKENSARTREIRQENKAVAAELRVRHEQLRQEMAGAQNRATRVIQDTERAVATIAEDLAAIREYAAQQQQTTRRYEEGFAWVAVKDFGRRIIRTADDIDDMLTHAGLSPDETTRLESIRDQLVYALESTGIEQFTPDLGTDAAAQSASVQVRSVQPAQNPAEDGTITEVVRPGYRLFVEENRPPKIIRPAEVIVSKRE